MALARTIAANTLVQLVGRIVTTALALIVIATLTRYLGVSSYGDYATVFAYVAFLGVLADSGFFWILLRELSQPKADQDRIASNVLTLRSILGMVVFGVGSLAAFLIPQYSETVRWGIVLISFGWFWTALNSTFVGVFQANQRMDQAVITDVLGRVVILFVVLWIAARGGSLLEILGAYALGNIVNFVGSLLLGRRFAKVRLRYEPALWRRIIVAALPMGLVIILASIYFKIDTVMLSLMKSNTDVGIYGAPYKILEVLLTVPTMFLGNIFPVLTRYLATKDERLPSVFQRSFDVLMIIAVPVVFGTIVLAQPILQFVAGQAYVMESTVMINGLPITGVHTLQILIVAVGISFFANLFNYLLVADGRQRELIAPNFLFVVVNVGTNLIAIPVLSYIGAALTTVVTEVVVVGVLGWLVFQRLSLRPSLKQIGRILLAGAGMTLLVYPLRELPIGWPVLVGVLSYPVLLWLTGVLTKEMVQAVLPRWGKTA